MSSSLLKKIHPWQFFVTFLGWLSDLLERLSDLQLGDKKVTLNHLVPIFGISFETVSFASNWSFPPGATGSKIEFSSGQPQKGRQGGTGKTRHGSQWRRVWTTLEPRVVLKKKGMVSQGSLNVNQLRYLDDLRCKLISHCS